MYVYCCIYKFLSTSTDIRDLENVFEKHRHVFIWYETLGMKCYFQNHDVIHYFHQSVDWTVDYFFVIFIRHFDNFDDQYLVLF